jgi:hypothetical protein
VFGCKILAKDSQTDKEELLREFCEWQINSLKFAELRISGLSRVEC